MSTQEPLLPPKDWMPHVYNQAGQEIRHEDTIAWQTFAIASAANAVLLNAVFSLWTRSTGSVPTSFKLAPFILGTLVSWATAYIIWRSIPWYERDVEVVKKIESRMAGQTEQAENVNQPTGKQLYSLSFQRRPGPRTRPVMIGAAALIGFGWLVLAAFAGYWWFSLAVAFLTVLAVLISAAFASQEQSEESTEDRPTTP